MAGILRRRMSVILALPVALAAVCLTSTRATGMVAFDFIQDPAFVGWAAGPDGLIGTPDDVPDARNIQGAVSWGIAPGSFTTFIAGVLTIPGTFVFENGVSSISDFTVAGDTTGPVGGLLAFNDLHGPSPHEIVTDLLFRQAIRVPTAVCFQPGPCTTGNALAVIDGDTEGFLLLRGTDPSDLAGIDPALASYLDLLTGVVPSDWTAIILTVGEGPGVLAFVTSDPVDLLAILDIDIRPLSDRNVVNPFGRGLIPVALFGSDGFDVADVDATTLAFGPDGAPAASGPWGALLKSWDVNRDGREDLVSFYRTHETGIAMGDTEACLSGETLGGMAFEGCDAVLTESRCGHGFELAFLMPACIWARRRRRSRPR